VGGDCSHHRFVVKTGNSNIEKVRLTSHFAEGSRKNRLKVVPSQAQLFVGRRGTHFGVDFASNTNAFGFWKSQIFISPPTLGHFRRRLSVAASVFFNWVIRKRMDLYKMEAKKGAFLAICHFHSTKNKLKIDSTKC
jgi:hypothetical protein